MTELPVYIKCSFNFRGGSKKYSFKIDNSNILAHPFQLFRSNGTAWENLSVYASISDAVMILLKELITGELADEIGHGQAVVNPEAILAKIARGNKTVSIYGSTEKQISLESDDVNFEDLVERKQLNDI